MKRSSVRTSVCLSARPSVCPIVRPQERRAAGLLLSTSRARDIDRQQALALSSNGTAALFTAADASSVR